jgi:hypothetical protein
MCGAARVVPIFSIADFDDITLNSAWIDLYITHFST